MSATTTLQSINRRYLPQRFRLTDWSRLKPYYQELLQRPIQNQAELEDWILDLNEVQALVSETVSRRYINLTVDSRDESAKQLYQYTVSELAPKVASMEDSLHKKLTEHPFVEDLDQKTYHIYLRSIRNTQTLFREANIALETEVQLKTKEYGRLFSEMTIGTSGQQMTLQQAVTLLEEPDRKLREGVYKKIHSRLRQDKASLEQLFDELLEKRHQIALNAGFDNYRDYKFQALGRFDYGVKDCTDFHESVEHVIIPILDELYKKRKASLAVSDLRPWDLHVDTAARPPLRPARDVEKLVATGIKCLNAVHPSFGSALANLEACGHLDLDARPGKRPGGYNMPLYMTGTPFIFMNATNSVNDIRTLMHESGHAIHSLLSNHYPLVAAKKLPAEIAELAAMTMELLTLDAWKHYFSDEAAFRRAKLFQLENMLRVLPWIAAIDQFQHWIYTNYGHSQEARRQKWLQILQRFTPASVKLEGLESYTEYLWHKQLHIFEVPFYYIEYGIAQLGAIGIWQRYRADASSALEGYMDALKLGYTQPVRTVYQTAGVPFDFSRERVQQLGDFVQSEIERVME